MATRRMRQKLDAELIAVARRALGARTESDGAGVGDEVVRDLDAARRRRGERALFRADVLRALRAETPRSR